MSDQSLDNVASADVTRVHTPVRELSRDSINSLTGSGNSTGKSSNTPSRQDLIALLSKLQKKLQASDAAKHEFKQKYEQLMSESSINQVVHININVDQLNTQYDKSNHVQVNGSNVNVDDLVRQYESQTVHVTELEQRLKQLQSRLTQTFDLLKQSKQRVNELQQQLDQQQTSTASQLDQLAKQHRTSLEQQTQQHTRVIDQLKHEHCDIIRAQQRIQADTESKIDQLQQANQSLTEQLSAYESQQSDLADMRQLLDQRSHEISELIDALDRERAMRDADKIKRDNEIDSLTHECERIRQDTQRELLRVENDKRDALNVLLQQYNQSLNDLHQAHATTQQHTEQLTAAQSVNNQLQHKVRELESEIRALQQSALESQQSRDRELRAIEFKHIDRFERAQRENQQHIHKLSAELTDRSTLIEQLQQRCRDLEHEIDTGKPTERKLYELASLQARRDESLQQLQADNRALKHQLSVSESKLSKYKTERAFLTDQLSQHSRSQSISQINIDYLRSIIVRYMQFVYQPEQRDQLTTVIARLLQFSKSDIDTVNRAHAQSNQTFFTSLFGASTNKQDQYKYSQSNISIQPSVLDDDNNGVNLYAPRTIADPHDTAIITPQTTNNNTSNNGYR